MRITTVGVKTFVDIGSTLLVAVAAAILLWTLLATPPSTQERIAEVQGFRIDPGIATNVVGDGSIAIVEFSDYQCPFCATHARTVFPEIKRSLIETGSIKYAVFNFPIEQTHPEALVASEAAECAAKQNRFWEMHERLFRESPAFSTSALMGYAEDLGMDLLQFEACLTGGETTAKIRSDQSYGLGFEVRGTPTFFVGKVDEDGAIDLVKRIRGSFSFEELMIQLTDLL